MTQLISEALRACDPELRQVLFSNVVLTGGGSLLAGFADRLTNELTRNFPHVRPFFCLPHFVSFAPSCFSNTKLYTFPPLTLTNVTFWLSLVLRLD